MNSVIVYKGWYLLVRIIILKLKSTFAFSTFINNCLHVFWEFKLNFDVQIESQNSIRNLQGCYLQKLWSIFFHTILVFFNYTGKENHFLSKSIFYEATKSFDNVFQMFDVGFKLFDVKYFLRQFQTNKLNFLFPHHHNKFTAKGFLHHTPIKPPSSPNP